MKPLIFVTMVMLALSGCKSAIGPDSTARAVTLREADDLDPAPNTVRVELVAARDGERYTYNGMSPGPTLRAKVGDTLQVKLTNDLDVPTTIHWHGVKVPWAMDGVTWMRAPVMPGATFDFSFEVERAGTFWYHPHFDTAHQVDRGLYGALIVEDPVEPTADTELILIVDADTEHGARDSGHGHGRRSPRWKVNGVSRPSYTVRGGTVVRARFVNASNAAFAALRWPDIRHIGSDQGLLPSMQTPDRLLLAPGDRADVEWLIGREGFGVMLDRYSLNGGDAVGDPVEVLRVVVDTPEDAPAGLAWPFQGGAPTPDPGFTDIVYAFAGSDRTGRWLINAESFPDVTIETIPMNSVAVIELRNLSPTEHPFHLHGLNFEVLSVNGQPPPYKMVEDTFNLRIQDQVRLRVRADNPGDWMTHCHILPHADEGMMTVLRVGSDRR